LCGTERKKIQTTHFQMVRRFFIDGSLNEKHPQSENEEEELC